MLSVSDCTFKIAPMHNAPKCAKGWCVLQRKCTLDKLHSSTTLHYRVVGCEFNADESSLTRCTLNKVFSTETHTRHSLVSVMVRYERKSTEAHQKEEWTSPRRDEGGVIEGLLMSWDFKKMYKISRNSMNEPGWKVIQGRLEPRAKQGKSGRA